MKTLAHALLMLSLLVLPATAAFGEGEATAPYPSDILYTKSGKPIVFSHRAHVEDFGNACDACHGGLFEVKAFAAEDAGDFTMAAINAGRYCGACHNGTTAFSGSDFEQCARCHIEGELKEQKKTTVVGPKADIVLGAGDNVAVFKHPAHAALACGDCHSKVFPMRLSKTLTNMDEIGKKRYCGACHDGAKAFDASGDCGKCHPKM